MGILHAMDMSNSDTDSEETSNYSMDISSEGDEEEEEDQGSWDLEWDEELEGWIPGSGSSCSELSSEEETSSYSEEAQEENRTLLELEDPESLSTATLLLTAVIDNNLDDVREILQAPEWYKVTGDFHNNLLQMAVQEDSLEVFDYLLASDMFPLDALNDKKQTALMISLLPSFRNMFNANDEYYAHELIKKGASISEACSQGNTLLHYAVGSGCTRIVKMLVEGGLNPNEPNSYGRTPFHACFMSLRSPQNLRDIISILLSSGADPSIPDSKGFTAFEHALRWQDTLQIQEMLFYHILENYRIKMDGSILLEAINSSSLFRYIITWPGLEISDSDEKLGEYITELFALDPEHLKIFISKGSSVVRKVLWDCGKSFENVFFQPIVLENFDTILESELRDDLIERVANCKVPVSNFIRMRTRESVLTKMICYLLSYGLNLCGSNLQDIYIRYGYCDLLKICLHMDIFEDRRIREIMPALIYDIHLNLQTCLKYSFKYSTRTLDRVLQHFAGEKVRDFCYRVGSGEIKARAKKLPQIPSLQELARNTFRQSFIDTFHIKTCRQFYTMVRKLPVCNIFKKMLTYEQHLY